MNPYKIICGDALAAVSSLPYSVSTVVTSPPYFRVINYGGETSDPRELGLEPSPDSYIAKLVQVFNAIRLRPDGSIWVNIGDKRKDGELMFLPERFVVAMAHAGWKLTQRVAWCKGVVDVNGNIRGNGVPISARRRLADSSFELFLRFTRGRAKDAWTDICAVGVPRKDTESGARYLPESLMECHTDVTGRGLLNSWHVYPKGNASEIHPASFPPALVERPIVMTCPPWICRVCGHARQRVTVRDPYDGYVGSGARFREPERRPETASKPITTGWTDCKHERYEPGIVLDPFMGSGTTGVVALKTGRRFIGIDLYQNFCDSAERRLEETLAEMQRLGLNPLELIR